jgi:hypothetical protein
MSGWNRTTKPSSDTSKPANTIFGVDNVEARANEGIASAGWVHRRVVGSRVLWETLVAMKTPPVETADNTEVPNVTIKILTRPVAVSTTIGGPVGVFTVVAEARPSGVITYQWQVSATLNGTYANVSASANYADVTTPSLTVTANLPLNGLFYRCVMNSTGAPVRNTVGVLFTVA